MTRLEKELSGKLGEYWRTSALNELEEVKQDLENGKITIDEEGIARNSIGRALMDDMLEKLAKVTDQVNVEETRAARQIEVSKELEEYRRNYKEPDAEELDEMRAAFGKGETVIDIITGKTIKL